MNDIELARQKREERLLLSANVDRRAQEWWESLSSFEKQQTLHLMCLLGIICWTEFSRLAAEIR